MCLQAAELAHREGVLDMIGMKLRADDVKMKAGEFFGGLLFVGIMTGIIPAIMVNALFMLFGLE